jgi:protocatechuate 3,4-dioxygenase beta subunit
MQKRYFLSLAFAALPVMSFAKLASTPPQTAGPFYPQTFPLDIDNDLVQVAGESQSALGEVTYLSGVVRDTQGRPLPKATVEIWQCDALQVYHHTPYFRGEGDPGFQGIGRFQTADDGRYFFRTIKPVPYSGRTPHIHVRVQHQGQVLTSQFYIAGHPRNAQDFLYSRLGERAEAVSLAFRPIRTAEENTAWQANGDLILPA